MKCLPCIAAKVDTVVSHIIRDSGIAVCILCTSRFLIKIWERITIAFLWGEGTLCRNHIEHPHHKQAENLQLILTFSWEGEIHQTSLGIDTLYINHNQTVMADISQLCRNQMVLVLVQATIGQSKEQLVVYNSSLYLVGGMKRKELKMF